jgi:hypothetical protein
MQLIKSLVIIIFSISLFACGVKKDGIGASEGGLSQKSSNFLIKELTNQYIDYDWFVGKARMQGEREGLSMSFTANVRIKRDSAIWMSLSKLGFEGFRVLIRPDSVFVISRLERLYIAEDIEAFARKYDINADFSTLQGLFTGEAPYIKERRFKSDVDSVQYYLHSTSKDPKLEYWLHGSRFFVEKIIAKDRIAGNVWAEFSDYQNFEDKQFSYYRDLRFETSEGENNALTIKWIDIKFNEAAELPFEINPRYERMDF